MRRPGNQSYHQADGENESGQSKLQAAAHKMITGMAEYRQEGLQFLSNNPVLKGGNSLTSLGKQITTRAGFVLLKYQ